MVEGEQGGELGGSGGNYVRGWSQLAGEDEGGDGVGGDRRVCCEGVGSVGRWWLCEWHAVVEEGAGVAELGGTVLEGAADVAVAAGGGAGGRWSAGEV